MPYIHFDSGLPDAAIGLWHVVEDEAFFLERLTLYSRELKRVDGISHPQKRLEWLSSRLCLKELLKINHQVESLNEHNGKPFLSDNSHRISYTHSANYAAAIASSTREVAIDIEALSRKRNYATKRLFMNEAEKVHFEGDFDHNLFLLVWSAKESLFKIVGQRGVSLRQHIAVDLDNFQLAENGTLLGTVKKDNLEKQFTVYYAIRPDFVLTYTFDGLPELEFQEELLYGEEIG